MLLDDIQKRHLSLIINLHAHIFRLLHMYTPTRRQLLVSHMYNAVHSPRSFTQRGGAQGGGLLGPVQRFSSQDHDSHSTLACYAIPLPLPAQA